MSSREKLEAEIAAMQDRLADIDLEREDLETRIDTALGELEDE